MGDFDVALAYRRCYKAHELYWDGLALRSAMAPKRRVSFLAACKSHLADLWNMEELARAGHRAKEVFVSNELGRIPQRSKSRTASTNAVFQQLTPVEPGIEKLRSYFHGLLIQEWQAYLDNSFEKAFLASKKKGTMPEMRPVTVDLSEILWQPAKDLRQGLTRQVIQSFSFLGCDEKIKTLRKLYAPKATDQIRARMKIHVAVRNVFQHNRGVVRKRDLVSGGVSVIRLQDNNGAPRQFEEGAAIKLSFRDIEDLVSVAEEYSLDFEVPI